MGLYNRGIQQLNKLTQRLLLPFFPKIIILLYHRVFDSSSDPQLLCVKPKHFIEHMEYLRRNFQIISLSSLARMLSRRQLPKKDTAVITFDDGYADNLYNAKPILERYEIPATVFVTAGYLGQRQEFWWDELERLLLRPGILPKMLKVVINGQSYQWDLEETADYTDDLYQRHCRWNVLDRKDPTPRQYVYRLLSRLLEPLPEQKKRELLDTISATASGKTPVYKDNRSLTSDELLCLAEGKLTEIGAHTVTHQILSLCTKSEQETEILQSKAYLEGLLGDAVKSFSYPHGRPSDYTMETIKVVQKAGFTSACCAYAGIIWHRTDCFQLPRLLIRDYDIATFSAHLKKGIYG